MNIINLTPHEINIYKGDENILTIAPSGSVARCSQVDNEDGFINFLGKDVPLFNTNYNEIENLPPEKPNTFYVVSMIIANRSPKRKDLLIPVGIVRNEKGQIIGCKGLSRI